MSEQDFLLQHVQLLLDSDLNFCQVWFALSEHERESYLTKIISIDKAVPPAAVNDHFDLAHGIARRKLLTVPEREFEHSRLPKDWPLFIVDDQRKNELFSKGFRSIKSELEKVYPQKSLKIYGGLKNLQTIDPARFRAKVGSAMQRALEDTWDAVRLRVVVPDLIAVEQISLCIWRRWTEEVLRCKNYYFVPKANNARHPYRAIHFQLSTDGPYPYEVQIMTLSSELVGHLEHASFKGRLQIPSDEHSKWLANLCQKALVYDVRGLDPQAKVSLLSSIASKARSMAASVGAVHPSPPKSST